MTHKSYISVTSSSFPGFTYIYGHRMGYKEKKMTCHQNPCPGYYHCYVEARQAVAHDGANAALSRYNAELSPHKQRM
jgi:hypothetical protein